MDDRYTSLLARLLKSQSWKAQTLGAAILLLFFAPGVFQAIDEPDLTIWKRAERIVYSLIQTGGAVALAAFPSETALAPNERRKLAADVVDGAEATAELGAATIEAAAVDAINEEQPPHAEG